MCRAVNENEKSSTYDTRSKQTVEMRSPDASADVYLLMAALCVACRYGFSLKDGVKIADSTYVNVNIHSKENEKLLNSLATLPDSCFASAETLISQRAIYEEDGVFSPAMIDGIVRMLISFDDRDLRAKLTKSPKAMAELVKTHFHCG
jgi:glutamine synthetase